MNVFIRKQSVTRYLKGDITFYWLGFIFAAFYIVIPSISDNFPLYRYSLFVLRFLLIVLLVFLTVIKRIKLTSQRLYVLLPLLLFCATYIIVSFIHGENIINTVYFCGSILAIPLFFSLIEGTHFYPALKGISLYFEITLFAYLLSLALFQERGLYNFGIGRNYYFWGHVNSSVKMALTAIVLFSLLDLMRQGRISKKTWILTFVVLAAQFISSSYVATVGMAVYIAAIIFFSQKISPLHVVPRTMPLFLSLGIFAAICLVQIPSLYDLMINVSAVVDRTGSITSRYMIWQQGLEAVKSNPFGLGMLSSFSKYIRLGNYLPSTAHNIYIDVAIQAGIPGVIFFVMFLYFCFSLMPDGKAYPVVPAALLAFGVMWNFEPYFAEPHFFCNLILLFACVSTESQKKAFMKRKSKDIVVSQDLTSTKRGRMQ